MLVNLGPEKKLS